MPRYKLTIAYDGTDFAGWQKQEPPMAAEPEALPPDHVRSPDPLALMRPELVDPTLEAPEGRVALRTVQAVVERAVREVVREPVAVRGASRTDSGVHARGQVAVFSCSGRDEGTEARRHEGGEEATKRRSDEATEGEEETERRRDGESKWEEPSRGGGWPVERGVERLVRALNGRLPEDVLVVGAEVVRDDFDPIGDCVSKGYAYRLHVSPTRPLWERRYVQQVWRPVDVELMNEAAARIVGEHDFAAFAAAGHGRVSTVREVHACRVVREAGEGDEATKRRSDGGGERDEETKRRRDEVRERGRGAEGQRDKGEWAGPLRIEVSGNGFLYNMVRIIAGTLVEVGRGKMSVDDVSRALESGDRRLAGPTMPAQGLCLEWVRYGEATGGRSDEATKGPERAS